MCWWTFTTQENATEKSRANHDEIRGKLNEIDCWVVEFNDKNVNECNEIFLKNYEKIIDECVPKIIDKTKDERKKMKQKQKWLNWKVNSALEKDMIDG